MHTRLQFPLSGLIVVVTMVAIVLGLGHWLGLVIAIPLATLPFSLIAERVLGGPRPSAEAVGLRTNLVRLGVVVVCALSTAACGWLSVSAGTPTLISPLPLLIILPALFGVPFLLVMAIPVNVFVILHFDCFRLRPAAQVPWRFPILLAIATACSALWLVGGWPYGLKYQGRTFTIGIIAINVILIAALWCVWLIARRTRSFGWRIAFGTLLNYWLFWSAFPWLGELP
jgi:hypothetical protein